MKDSYINAEAVFSDETENFIIPTEPSDDEQVTIRLRTASHNVDSVFLIMDEKEVEVSIIRNEKPFDYYEFVFDKIPKKVSYYFKITKKERVYFYNKKGLMNEVLHDYNFNIIPNWKMPEWSKSAVMYQIYVDRFNNGDKTNDVMTNEYKYLSYSSKKLDWEKPVEATDIANHYGGDLQGIIDKLDYLKDLGIEVLYLNPVFVSPSNHKYDIQDYDYIDPHFAKIVKDEGEELKFEKFTNEFATKYISRTTDKENLEASNAFFADFVQKCHDKGIKVIIDGVFNHCGAFNKWLDKEGFYEKNGYDVGAYSKKESKYHDYFSWGSNDDYSWPKNNTYSGWWGHDNHPKLNFEGSKELENYIMNIGAKWVSNPFNVDGWRLDVAADLGFSQEYNHEFWQKFRKSVKGANSEAIIISEHYGDPSSWLGGDQWDTVMNYDAFMEPITWFLTGMEKHSESFDVGLLNNHIAFEESMRYHKAKLSHQSLYSAMNQLSNHDHSRFLTRTNMICGRLHTSGAALADENIKIEVMMEAIVMQMTWIGSPTLYYGDEVGLSGWTDPDNRRTYPWGKENMELHDFYKKAIAIHKENPALKLGSLDKIYFKQGVLCYGRWLKDNAVIVCVNNNEKPEKVLIPVWRYSKNEQGVLQGLLEHSKRIVSHMENEYQFSNGYLEILLPPKSSKILREKL